jgi:hypothetical protein
VTTLATLKARIASDLARDDLTSEIADAISDAIKILRRRRYSGTEGRLTSSTALGQEYLAWPAGLMELDALTLLQGTTPLHLVERRHREMEEWAVPAASATGIPTEYAKFANTVRFYPIPDAVYSLTWTGLVEVTPALTTDLSSNYWTLEGEMLTRQTAKALIWLNVIRNGEEASAAAATVGLTPEDLIRSATRKRGTGRVRVWSS